MDTVNVILKQWRSSTFEWGRRDCLLSIADYLTIKTGQDWGACLRGTYDDESSALAIMAAHGGAAGMIDRTGLERTDKPARGDILLLDLPARPIAAICTGRGAAARGIVGVTEIDLRFIKICCAWKVP